MIVDSAFRVSLDLKLTPRYLVAFIGLSLILGEAHELVHVLSGALICGGFGERDFNVWGLKEGCSAVLPTALGPLFTYGVSWIAAAWLAGGSDRSKVLALSLVFASGLLGRVLTTILGGGDEVVVAKALLPSNAQHLAVPSAIGAAFAASVLPLSIAWRALNGRLAVFLLLLMLPFATVVVVVLLILNTALSMNVLSGPLVLGAPPLVYLYDLLLICAAPFVLGYLRRGAIRMRMQSGR